MSRHDYNAKPFIKAATGFLEEKLLKFRKDIAGTPLEPHAITYGIQEGWLMPNEGLEALTILNLFPNAWPADWAQKLVTGQIGSEREAKVGLAEAMAADLREANAGIEKVRFSGTSQSVAGGGTKTPDTAAVPVPEGENPSSAALLNPPEVPEPAPESKSPATALQEPARGIPEALVSTTVRVHRVTLGEVELVTTDREHLEMLQAAQVQKRVLKAAWEESPIGNLITGLCLSS
jgi:hypothetical protein